MFLNEHLPLSNSKVNQPCLNGKISLFFICIEAITYLLLHNFHGCTFKINKKDTCIKELETNLVFNTGKTKFMLISSKQLSARHKLKDE